MPTRVPTKPADDSRAAPRGAGRATLLIGLIVAVLSFGAIAHTYWSETVAPFGPVLTIKVVFPEGTPGANEPLIAAGTFSNADFLSVKYLDAATAVLAFDSWGSGGPDSLPFSLNPGTARTLSIEMPTLARTNVVKDRAPVRLVLDGQELLNAEVSFHRPAGAEVFFAQNPIGGSPAMLFRGKMFTLDDRPIAGGAAGLATSRDRWFRLWQQRSWSLVLALIACGLFGYGMSRAPWLRWIGQLQGEPSELPQRTAPHGTMIIALLLCAACFVTVITGGTFKLFFPESFGTFYDYQAASLLDGRLDVPTAALSGESFLFEGKCYGYFGPTPALLRIPFALLGIGFGELSRPLMVLQFIACLWAVYALLCRATKMRSGDGAWPSRWATLVLLLSCGLGSTLFFVASRAYIYHEAILCGAAFGLWACYCTLRYLETPGSGWWIAALICGTLAVHSRPPLGLYALVFTGVAAAINLFRPTGTVPSRRGLHFAIGAMAVAGVLSYNGLSYLKFRTIDGCPLRYNVQYTPSRLAAIEGKQFHLSNLRFGFDAYFGRRTIQTSKHFPYLETKGLDARRYPSAKLDMTEPLTGVPWAMPGLTLLAVLGLVTWGRSNGALRLPIVAIWVAVLPTALAMFAAVAVSHRYSADFVPFLVTSAALGIAAVDRWGGALGTAWRWLIGLVCVLSIAITLALTVRFQGEVVWGVPEETQRMYKTLQSRIDGWFGRVDPSP